MFFVALAIRRHRFNRSFVHPLRADEEPVLIEFIVAERGLRGALFTLQPLFGPLPQFVIPIERGTRLVHANWFAQNFSVHLS